MADFTEHFDDLKQIPVGVVALSVDDEEHARALAEEIGVPFPVLYGLDARAMRDRIGAYVEEEKGYLHATSFLLDDGGVAHATYSSGPLGRLRADNVAKLVRYHQKQAQEG